MFFMCFSLLKERSRDFREVRESRWVIFVRRLS